MGIQRLPSAVVSSLRTDVTVTTTAQCVTELVLNAIDASATAIAVRVDLKNYRIQVVDNGCGLSSSDLNVIGTRYMTSKCHSLQDLQSNLSHFGYRGEALSSISEVCGTMTISSRCRGSEETYCKVFTRGMGHNVGKSRQQRASFGTTITVADFLFNRPVRRARIKPALDLEEIKSHMESIALINPFISFSLRNDISNEVVLQTQRAENIPSAFSSLFSSSSAQSLVAVEESMGPFKVKGFISNEAHLLKNLQFIYVNKRLLLKTKIHKLVNSIMSRSVILKSNNVPYVPISKEIHHGVFLAFSPPKRDKHAVFILNITCPLSEYDITLDPKKTLVEFCNWDCLLSCIECLLRKFIEKEAGLDAGKDQAFGIEPPRKVLSVVDEINQLTREEALGGNVSQTTEESISTRDFSRAIHSLPANRCQLDLSLVPPLDCLPSTATSSSYSSALSTISPVPSSVLTEKPYLPSLNGDLMKRGSKATNVKQDSCWMETDSSSVQQTSFKPKYAVDQLKCLFKRPEDKSAAGKGPVKGFITDTIHFEENFRRIPDRPVVSKADHCKGTAVLSPVNALASIKEIRRKKMLNNLNKFSFKMACEKPVLHKAQQLTSSPTESDRKVVSKADHGLQQVDEIFREKSQESMLRDSTAVQTPLSLDHSEDMEPMASQIATVESSPAALSISTNTGNDCFTEIPHNFAISDEIQCIENEIESCLKNKNYEVKGNEEYRDILSVEDMIVTRYAIRERMTAPLAFSDSPNLNPIPPAVCTEASEESVMPEKRHVPLDSEAMFQNMLHVNKPDTPCIKISSEDFSRSVSSASSVEQPMFLSKPTNIYATKLEMSNLEFSEDASCSGTNSEQQIVKLKIVDYDSSPSSSQETYEKLHGSFESDSSSPSQLKRKQDKHTETAMKKFCSSHESSGLETYPVMEDGDKNIEDNFFQNSVSDCVLEKDTGLGVNLLENRSNKLESLELSKSDRADDSEERLGPIGRELVKSPNEEICKVSLNFVDLDKNNVLDYSEERLDPTGKELSNCPNEEISKVSFNFVHLDKNNVLDRPIQVEENQAMNEEINTSNHCANSDALEKVDDAGALWVEQLDHKGKPFYFHKKSGITTYQKPSEVKDATFKFGDRFSFLPKGMSPILLDKCTNETSNSPSIVHFRVEEDLSAVKWGMEQAEKKADFWPLVDQLLSESDKFSSNLCTESQVSNATVQDLSQADIKVYNVLFPYSFTKDIFNNLRVLGQLDNKFIVTIVSLDPTRDVVVLFDQHAVHERIRVENLTEEYKQHDGAATWKSAPVDPALPLSLSSIEVRILESYSEKMERLGLHFSVVDSNTISVLRVPTCLLLRENREVTGRGVSVLRQHLESLIREQVDSLLNTRGVGTDHPTIIRNVISSEACRGAVKFGHSLTVKDCEAFLHNLSLCNLPFQCAHGRPALVPIVDLSMLKPKQRVLKPNLRKLQN